jgi:zinc transporter ZupT
MFIFSFLLLPYISGHEVTQEMADFCLLISRGNMSVGAAVTANLLSGVSCIIGAVVASYVEMSEEAIGGLLAFSGGVYLWAAMCECVAPLVKETKGWSVILIRISMFVVGAVCIGLVLLNHVHCEAKTAPIQPAKVDSHAGHNH